MAEEETIVIDSGDIPNRSPKEMEIEKVVEQARKGIIERLTTSSTLADFLRWQQALVWTTTSGISWMWDYGEVTSESLISDYDDEKHKAGSVKEANLVNTLMERLNKLPPKGGSVRIAVKRARDESGLIDYRVLVAFPLGVNIVGETDALMNGALSEVSEVIVFFKPENACVKHACDDLYKAHKGEESFYIPLIDLEEAKKRIKVGDTGQSEYMLGRTEERKITQNTENYILVALMGGFSNERLRIRVSDFFNKSHVT